MRSNVPRGAKVQFELAIYAVNPFVVPWVPLDVAQMQKTQAEPPGFAGTGQTGQQIGDFFILDTQLGAIAIAGLADPKSPAGQRNTDTSSFDRRFGHLAAVTHGKCAHLPSYGFVAQIGLRVSFPFPRRTQPTASVTGRPIAV